MTQKGHMIINIHIVRKKAGKPLLTEKELKKLHRMNLTQLDEIYQQEKSESEEAYKMEWKSIDVCKLTKKDVEENQEDCTNANLNVGDLVFACSSCGKLWNLGEVGIEALCPLCLQNKDRKGG